MRSLWQQCLVLFLMHHAAFAAEDLLSMKLIGESGASNAFQAKKEIQEKLVLEASQKILFELIGAEEYTKKREQIDRVVRAQYGKFIPFMSPEDLPRRDGKFVQAIEFQISKNSLRELLSREGLLYEKTTQITVLPMLSFLDSEKARSYKWWYSRSSANDPLVQVAGQFSQEFKDILWKEGFYLIIPEQFAVDIFLPEEMKQESHRRSDMAKFAKKEEANLVVFGSVRFSEDEDLSQNKLVSLKLKAMLVKNEKLIAETEKKWSHSKLGSESEEMKVRVEYFKEALSDLVSQVKDAWEKGKFSTESLKLNLKAELNHKEFEEIKELIRSSSYQIKNLKERRLTKGAFLLELDVSGQTSDILKQLQGLKSENWSFQASQEEPDEIDFAVKRREEKSSRN